MKITRKKLRKLILKEMFKRGENTGTYSFNLKTPIDQLIKNKSVSFVYKFEANSDEGLIGYSVKIVPLFTGGWGDAGYPIHWDVSFDSDYHGAGDSFDGESFSTHNLTTNQFDLKVLNTVIAVVKDFVSNVRPKLKKKDENNPNGYDHSFDELITFMSEASQDHELARARAQKKISQLIASGNFKTVPQVTKAYPNLLYPTDDRRARIYLYMLKQNGIKGEIVKSGSENRFGGKDVYIKFAL